MPAEMEPARFMVARDRSSRSPGEEVVRLEHGREQLLQSLGGRIADFAVDCEPVGVRQAHERHDHVVRVNDALSVLRCQFDADFGTQAGY